MRYYVVNGYRVSAHAPVEQDGVIKHVVFSPGEGLTRRQSVRSYKELGIPLPELGESQFLRIPKLGRISVFVHGPYHAFLLLTAHSQRKAYLLGNALRAGLTCFQGITPSDTRFPYLLELDFQPTPDMTRRDLVRGLAQSSFLEKISDSMLALELMDSVELNQTELKCACELARKALLRPLVLDALLHLEQSRKLVWGFMVGSYYDSHYSQDRQKLSRYQRERIYLENRFKYDSAFVSAFRGIECLLGRPSFKRRDIPDLLLSIDQSFNTCFARSRHRSFHEVFSSGRKWWRYEDLIGHYLRLRNSVSAHGNPSPPHIVMEDQVIEIQYLLQSMILDILSPKARQE
jgi:hypothetical protein